MSKSKGSLEKQAYKLLDLMIREGFSSYEKEENIRTIHFYKEDLSLTVKREFDLETCAMKYSIVNLLEIIPLTNELDFIREIENPHLRKLMIIVLIKTYRREYKKKEMNRYKKEREEKKNEI